MATSDTFQYVGGPKEDAGTNTAPAKHTFGAAEANLLTDFVNALLTKLGLQYAAGAVTGTLSDAVLQEMPQAYLQQLAVLVQPLLSSAGGAGYTDSQAVAANAGALQALQTAIATQLQAISGLDATQTAAIQAAQAALAADDGLLAGLLATQQQQAAQLASLGGGTGKLVAPIGNSLVSGEQSSTGPVTSPYVLTGNDFPAVLSRAMPGFSVLNLGVSGERTSEVAARARVQLDFLLRQKSYQRVYTPTWEITNALSNPPVAAKEVAYAEYADFLENQRLQGAYPLAMTVLARGGLSQSDVDWINQKMRAEWSRYAYELVDPAVLNLNRPDGIHLDDAGYAVVAAEVAEKISYIETGFARVSLLGNESRVLYTTGIVGQTAHPVNGYVEVVFSGVSSQDYVLGFIPSRGATGYAAMDAGLHITGGGVSAYGSVVGTGNPAISAVASDVFRLVWEQTRFVILKNRQEVFSYAYTAPANSTYFVRSAGAGGANPSLIGMIGAYTLSV